MRVLRQMHQEAVEVKESFREEDEQVQFALLAKRPSLNRWEELARVERPRLKTARLRHQEAHFKYIGMKMPVPAPWVNWHGVITMAAYQRNKQAGNAWQVAPSANGDRRGLGSTGPGVS